MQLIILKTAFVSLLMILFFHGIHVILHSLTNRFTDRARLKTFRIRQTSAKKFRLLKLPPHIQSLWHHISILLESSQSVGRTHTFFLCSGILWTAGTVLGAIWFSSIKGMLVTGMIPGFLPYLFLRLRVLRRQMTNRLEFLPAVEIFYQHYLLQEHRNVRSTLQALVEEGRLLYPIKPVFEQLDRNLSTRRSEEESLQVFSVALGHMWSRYFANILAVQLREGADIGESLKELIVDMRRAAKSRQTERNRLLEIRIANFSPAFFLFLFMAVNFKINPAQAYTAYFIDPAGKEMLLDALLLIFASLSIGIYLSIKRL